MKETKWSAHAIESYLKRLFPINRSLTGTGNRKTLEILKEIVPLDVFDYLSGTTVYDWKIPSEWNVKQAWIKDAKGNKLVDFSISNLHLVGYSEPYRGKISFDELKNHLYYSPSVPDGIPYRTSYYKKAWGFCVKLSQYESLANVDGLLEVCVDTEFNPLGSLAIGELLIPGKSSEEVLVSTYFCHPSLANDNLSGTLMTALLAKELLNSDVTPNKSYRFIWVPETIGAIAYCAKNEGAMKHITTGVVVTTVGGPGTFGYKQSFEKEHYINALIEETFDEEGIDYIKYPFDIDGSDERQYSSPGFRINVASITKDKYYEYPYYHNSKDDLEFVTGDSIRQSLQLYMRLLEKIDQNVIYQNCVIHGEVMLSKHQLYPELGGGNLPGKDEQLAMRKWILFYSDGRASLLDISEATGFSLQDLSNEAKVLYEKRLLQMLS